MSSEYRPEKQIPIDSLSSDRLAKYGVRVDWIGSTKRLEGSDGFLFVSAEGDSVRLEHRGNPPMSIIKAIMTEFDTDIFGEDDYQFWGFGSEKEMAASFGGSEQRRDQRLADKDDD